MSKKRREKMKAKAIRHSKPEQADENRKAAASETSQANQKKAQKHGSIAANVPSGRNGGVAEATASIAKKPKAAMESLDAKDAPHLKGMSSSWRAFYEEIARKARA
jgi:hypothetical protein